MVCACAGMGALHWAAAAGDEACLAFLRERALDVDALSWAGLSPLAYAARAGHAGAVRLLLADADPNVGACAVGASFAVPWTVLLRWLRRT